MSPPLLAVKGLTKRYGSLLVTDDVYLDIATGEAHALIGPNGAGKTTLIHQLAGTLGSNSGSIALEGEDITHLPMDARVRKGLARSFQITSILPGYTVLENVALAVQARSGSSLDGLWRIDVEAPTAGKYRYKFLVDGKNWVEDPANLYKQPNIYGGFDSILFIT